MRLRTGGERKAPWWLIHEDGRAELTTCRADDVPSLYAIWCGEPVASGTSPVRSERTTQVQKLQKGSGKPGAGSGNERQPTTRDAYHDSPQASVNCYRCSERWSIRNTVIPCHLEHLECDL